MNDEWSRCPICFEDYSLEHRPTTFFCGHSTCIDHTSGPKRLQHCPICRHPLRQNEEYHVSYNLEEASRLFQVIKNTIDWSTVKLLSASVANHEQTSTSGILHNDMIYARRLQAELNRETAHRPHSRTPNRRNVEPVPTVEVATVLPTSRAIQSSAREKTCGHRCDLITTEHCCTCTDRRPIRPSNRYDAYVDGVGTVDAAVRNEYYCPTCKQR